MAGIPTPLSQLRECDEDYFLKRAFIYHVNFFGLYYSILESSAPTTGSITLLLPIIALISFTWVLRRTDSNASLQVSFILYLFDATLVSALKFGQEFPA